MCFSKPKVDNSIQVKQQAEALEARRGEEARENRIRSGTGMIDGIFSGGTVGDGVLAPGTAYDPNTTYYTGGGDAWQPNQTPNPNGDELESADKQFARMLKGGGLYSGTKQVTGFDDAFFGGQRDAYMDFYQPQLDDQFGQAKDQLTYALARAGTLNSTLAADKSADLTKKYDVQKASVLSQANDQVAQNRSRINNEKSALVAQLNATGDANRVSNEALSRTQQMYNEAPAYNPLGDIFSGVAAGIGNYVNARNDVNAYNSYFGNGQSRNARTVY